MIAYKCAEGIIQLGPDWIRMNEKFNVISGRVDANDVRF